MPRSGFVAVPSHLTAGEALEELKAGNARFVAGAPRARSFNPHIAELAGGQNPFAVVLGCSDSRVPIETVFDQEPGNVFVVRVAGNFVNDDNLGSVEFAIAILRAPLILVLGHSGCGAVTAAVAYVRDGIVQPGRIQGIVDAVAPSVRAARGLPGDLLDNAIAQNVRLNAEAMASRSKIISEPVAAGELQVIGGIYDVSTGRVAFAL